MIDRTRGKGQPGTPIPRSLILGASQRREQAAAERLEEKKKTLLGNFDTKLPCPCGGTVTDEATQTNPHRRTDPRSVRFDAPRDARALNASFAVYHRYVCHACGIIFDNTIIEKVRGYVPKEQRPKEKPGA
ncbi:MAG TPA: hypothetical protein VGB97_01440 [Candidatus Paceibacterota bacterium]|jgi:hypothetical protein